MLRPILVALTASAALLGATAAHAGTRWSIGINVPLPGVVVANGGYYEPAPAPVYYEPAPVYYAPPPVRYYEPRYVRRDVYYAPPRVVYEHRWDGGRGNRWEPRRDDHWDHRDHGRDDSGPHRGR